MVGGGEGMAGTKRSACVKIVVVCSRVFFLCDIQKKKKKNLPRAAWELFPKSSVILTSTCGEIIGELRRI